MEDLSTYIKEGFYKNTGADWTKIINSLPDKLYNYTNTLRQLRGISNAFDDRIKNINIWNELYELFLNLPSFKISYENIFTVSHSYEEPDTLHQYFTFVKNKDHFYYTCDNNYDTKSSLNTKGDIRRMRNAEELLRYFLFYLKFLSNMPRNIIEQAKNSFKFELL